MAKKKTEEQLDLIDVQPENAKEILAAARAYKDALGAHLDALVEEVKQKQTILTLVKAANLPRDQSGVIKFKLDNIIISITPCDDKIKIQCPDEDEDKSQE